MGWLDYARVRYGGPYLDGQVDTVFALIRLLPIIACMIIYWTVYLQVSACAVDLRISNFRFSFYGKVLLPVLKLSYLDKNITCFETVADTWLL